jgi:3-hydroxyisobutyrate dehydrogenase
MLIHSEATSTKQNDSISKTEIRNVGFIGLGIMGRPMAMNLARGGFSLTVFNRSKHAYSEFQSIGARIAKSPREVALGSDVVIDMVTDAPDVEEVLFGPDGVVEGAHSGLVVIDMSTNSPEIAASTAERLAMKSIDFLDAPVTGGDRGAREGSLTIMVGGNKEVFTKCLPILKKMGKEIVYMGKTGSGQATKLANQVAVSIHTLATCEALLFGSACGLDLNLLLRVLTSGAASSWNLVNLGPRIIKRDFEPGFKAAHIHKDLKYVMRVAEKERLALPGAATVHQLMNAVLAGGYGEKGTQALAKILEKLASREIIG